MLREGAGMTLPHFPLLPEAIPALWLPGKTQSPGSVHGCFSQPSFLESEAEATGDHSLPADPQPASWQSHHQAPLAFWNNNSQPKQRQNPAGATVCVCVCGCGRVFTKPQFPGWHSYRLAPAASSGGQLCTPEAAHTSHTDRPLCGPAPTLALGNNHPYPGRHCHIR